MFHIILRIGGCWYIPKLCQIASRRQVPHARHHYANFASRRSSSAEPVIGSLAATDVCPVYLCSKV